MKIAIAGAGAMGCRFGYMLLEAGHDVTLIDSWQEHVDAIRSKGLFVETETTQKYYPIPAMLADESQGSLNWLFCLPKPCSWIACYCVLPLLPAAKVVMILSNGLGNIETLEKYVDRQKIYAGVTLWSSELEGAGHIMATGTGTIELQPIASQDSAQEAKVIATLNSAGLNAEISPDVLLSIWKKAAFNSVMNTYCALLDCNVGGFGQRPGALDLAQAVVDEFVLVAASQNIPLTEQMVMNTVKKVFDPRESGHHYPSMHQDLHKGRLTEIDYLNGAIARIGAQNNIAVPVNTLLTQLIHAKEAQ